MVSAGVFVVTSLCAALVIATAIVHARTEIARLTELGSDPFVSRRRVARRVLAAAVLVALMAMLFYGINYGATLVPHRRFWSHSLLVSPLLRLLYFYLVLMAVFLGCAWLLGRAGIAVPDYHIRATEAIFTILREYPDQVRVFLLGFITGSAAHTIADWLVTGGKHYLHALGIRVRRDYSNHDRWVSRAQRAHRRARSWGR